MSRTVRVKKWWLLLWLVGFSGVTGTAWAEAPPASSHTVQSGEALSLIAEKYGVALSLLREVNKIGDADKIRPGQTLLLPQVHLVSEGEVLGTIAERYGISLRELYRINDLNEKSVIRVGQRLILPASQREPATTTKPLTALTPAAPVAGPSEPKLSESKAPATPAPVVVPAVEYYEHKVRQGEALSIVAKRYSLTTRELIQENKLKSNALIRVGQTLKIPVNSENLHLTRPKPPPPQKSWQKFAGKNFKRGQITLRSFARKWSGPVFDKDGNLLPAARRGIHSMLGAAEHTPISPQLIQLMVQVSDEFGGRPLRVVSGYRTNSYSAHSKHPLGRALDFSIPGVPNSVVVDYLLTLPNAGVGYYPNSTHVHLDSRGYRMHWVDTSGPGQAPRYVHKSNTGQRAPVVLNRKQRPTRPLEARRAHVASLALNQN